MAKKYLFRILLFLLPLFAISQQPKAIQGFYDLTSFDFGKHVEARLNGEWLFYENVFLFTDSVNESGLKPLFAKVPLGWDEIKGVQTLKNRFGIGTYRLLIKKNTGEYQSAVFKDIGSSYKVWMNGKTLKEVGRIGKSAEECVPCNGTFTIPLPTDTNQVDLVVEVSNFHQAKGGIKTHVAILRNLQLVLSHERDALLNYFCLGIIFIIGLYHMGLFVMNRSDRASLNFGLFCFDIFVFLVFRGRIINFFYAEISWEFANKVEYITLYYSLPLFYIFFYRSFPDHFRKFFNSLAVFIAVSLIAVTLFTPTIFFSKTLTFFHLILLLYIVVVLMGLARSLASKQHGARIILAGFIVFMIALINDILHVQNIIDTGNFVVLGIVGFIICLAYFLAFRTGLDQQRIRQLLIDLKELNVSLERFVPADFMQLLKRKAITEVNLGNFVEMEMTIMFSDIRSFTTISEKLPAEDSFDFINDYLQVMGPIIRKHGGFIDKYIGDGIMALFPSEPNDAILCSQEMMNALIDFNQKNEKAGKPVIAIGIGLHTGTCILGTVGEPRRMDTTVISDSVNLAARIESLTKHYKTPVIISADTYNRIHPDLVSHIRFIGTAQVKGKSIQTALYKVFYEKVELRLLDEFDQAIGYFYEKEFGKARSLLLQLSQTIVNDGVLQLYLQRSTHYETHGTPENWQTFEVFEY